MKMLELLIMNFFIFVSNFIQKEKNYMFWGTLKNHYVTQGNEILSHIVL